MDAMQVALLQNVQSDFEMFARMGRADLLAEAALFIANPESLTDCEDDSIRERLLRDRWGDEMVSQWGAAQEA